MRFAELERWLGHEIGLDPGSIGPDEIARAAGARMRELGLGTVEAYLGRLHGDALERDELIEAVLVPETWFFREPGALAILRDRVAAHAAAGRRTPFRILSMPCATGEEPYSMAMTLVEAGTPREAFHIDGVDISQRSLAHAQRAAYHPRALRHVPAAVRDRFFTAAGERFHLRDEIARLVHFRRGNLVDPRLLRGSASYDAIFCRNALMYLTPAMRQRVLQHAAAHLTDTGMLFTGHAEGLRIVRPLFVSAGLAHAFAYRKTGDGPAAQANAAPVLGSSQVPRAVVPAPGHRGPFARVESAESTDRAAVGRPPGREADVLSEIKHLADAGQLEAARGRCLGFLATRPTSAEGYYLRGVIDLAARRRADAEEALRRAIYLDPRHEAALRLLARERDRHGDHREAAQLRRRARLARGHDTSAQGARS